jgi:hypothetical protein
VTSPAPSGLALLVVRVDAGSLAVVVGSTGFGTSGAIVLPPDALVVIPGQGESSVRQALETSLHQASLLPGGFRAETLIVVGSSDDVGLAERVRDLLGVGSVSVSGGSGIAPVTVVIGKDFTG